MYEELVKRLREYAKEHCPLDRVSGIYCQSVSKADEFGKSEQLADDSRRYAKWNLDGSCSACGTFSLSTYGNFCCYCGAEMREDKVPESDIPLNNVDG